MSKKFGKLALKKTTVRSLTDDELGSVQGGMTLARILGTTALTCGGGGAQPTTTAINCTAYCGGGSVPTTTAPNCTDACGGGMKTTAITCP